MSVDTKQIHRYRNRSLHLLESAINEMRGGRWSRAEDLLWGSLTLAVKGVALSQGKQLSDETQVQEYAAQLGQERRDRRIRYAFKQLAKFAEAAEGIHESRVRLDRLVPVIENVSSAVDRLWEMVPVDETGDENRL